MKKPTKQQLIDSRQSCIFLLTSALSDWADSVGVKGFSLSPCFNGNTTTCCFIEAHEHLGAKLPTTLEYLENEQAIAVFLGIITAAMHTKGEANDHPPKA